MKSRILVTAVLALVVTVLVALAQQALPPSTATGPLSGIKVCLDPGHGGADPGAVNTEFNLHESDINLDIAFTLRNLMVLSGAEVVMTRTDDSYLENRPRYTFCNNEQATILISVHTNSAVESSWDGALGLYFHADDKVLAQAIYDVMLPQLGSTAPPEVTFTPFGLNKYASGVLLKSDMPAAMMEPLFMSNPYEAALLQQPINGAPGCEDLSCRRGQIARALHDGTIAYFDLPGPAPTPTPEPGGTMHISAIDMWSAQKGRGYTVYTRVAVVDASGNPVSAASVSLSTTLPDGSETSSIASTDAAGLGTFSLRSKQSGQYMSEVTAVSKAGWTYDSASNIKTSEFLSVP